MTTFQKRLGQLESRLQALIEGGMNRLFPSSSRPKDLAQHLVAAMLNEIRPSPEGKLLAPNHFTIFLPLNEARLLQNQPELLEELAKNLEQACLDNQVRFAAPPVIKVLPNLGDGGDEFQVLAQYSLVATEITSALPPLPVKEYKPGLTQAFLIVDGSQIFILEDQIVNIGRHEENHLVLQDTHVSRSHAQLRMIRGRYVIFDLGSTGGTFVNGKKISQCTLKPGDVISLGGIPLVFGIENHPDPDRTQELFSSTS